MDNISNINENKSILSPGKLTIADIAKELQVSKSTVSRAISGKGRIGKETVQKINEYIDRHNFKPNAIAKGLADSKTYNIGVAFPVDTDFINTPFFQICLLGICEVAAAMNYDVVVTTVKETDINLLKRLVEHNKVDGVILTRNLDNDLAIPYLKNAGIPFVLVGSSEDDTLVQIDNNHLEACEKLVSLLIANGVKGIAMIMGDRKHMVNRYRCEGYFHAMKNNRMDIEQDLVFADCSSPVFVEQAVHNILKRNAECIVCTDDVICGRVLSVLREEGYRVPEDIKVASFYDSVYMKSNNPPVTAIGFDAEELGTIAGKRLIGLIAGDSNKSKTVLDYEIHLRRSTK
ncbi:MAG: transcriptional regulator, LacI family [Anaerocolumna sp.]|jgi:DNA-binding LacI/PurR family transcriptional regulator|nr:transcriptional regulator, LacI family [Anaerocolumna sp.]